MQGMMRGCLLGLVLWGLAGCVGGEKQGDGLPTTGGTCDGVHEGVERTSASVGLKLGSMWGGGSLGAQGERVKEVKTHFDRLQNDYQLTSQRLCEDFKGGRVDQKLYGDRSWCLSQSLNTLRALELLLEGAEGRDPEDLLWKVEEKLERLDRLTECEGAEAKTRGGEEVLEDMGACQTSASGVLDGVARFQTGGGFVPCQDLKAEVQLVCKRDVGGGKFVYLKACHGANMRQGDRFGVEVSANRDAYVYMYLYNSTGQFQSFFPKVGESNAVQAGTPLWMPGSFDRSKRAWVQLDDVSNVLETVQVVVSLYPIADLEAVRGLNLPPSSKGTFDPRVGRVRGTMEPTATRGGDEVLEEAGGEEGEKGAPAVKNQAEEAQAARRYQVSGKDAVAKRFVIRHIP